MSEVAPISAIRQVRVNVKDLPRAVSFYRDTLEIPFLFEQPDAGIAFFECAGVRLYLAATESSGQVETATIYYEVPDLDAAYEALSVRGVEFTDPPHTVYRLDDVEGRMAFLLDSEGNSVALMAETRIP
jgi:predicted enzyme related to lactoylglutathione lyase